MNLQPLYDRILIRRDATPGINTSIIQLWLPNQPPQKVQTGTVVACGPGFRDEKGAYHQLTVNEGDKVAFMRLACTEMKEEGSDDDLVVLREFDLLGRINPPDPDNQQSLL